MGVGWFAIVTIERSLVPPWVGSSFIFASCQQFSLVAAFDDPDDGDVPENYCCTMFPEVQSSIAISFEVSRGIVTTPIKGEFSSQNCIAGAPSSCSGRVLGTLAWCLKECIGTASILFDCVACAEPLAVSCSKCFLGLDLANLLKG